MTRRLRLAAALVRVANNAAENRLKKLLRPRADFLVQRPFDEEAETEQLRYLLRDAPDYFLRYDPTPQKKYVPWFAKQFNDGKVALDGWYSPPDPQLRLYEDGEKVAEALSLLERFRTSPALRGVNVMDLDWRGLDDLADRIMGKSGKPDLAPEAYPGLEVVHDDGTYRVYMARPITGRDPEADAASEAGLRKIGLGTKWCTRDDYPDCYARGYLEQGPVFVVARGGRVVLQFSWSGFRGGELQAMDTRDREFDFDAEPALKPIVFSLVQRARGRDRSPDGDVKMTTRLDWRDPEVERGLLQDAEKGRAGSAALLADYALDVVGGPWPEGDAAILRRAAAEAARFLGEGTQEGLYFYWQKTRTRGERWPEAEPFLAQDPRAAFHYSRVTRRRFPAAEPSIARSRFRHFYAAELALSPEELAGYEAHYPADAAGARP